MEHCNFLPAVFIRSFHLPLLGGFIKVNKKAANRQNAEFNDLGDLGDNVPATLLEFLSTRRQIFICICLSLSICFISTLAFAANSPPSIVSITPASGTSNSNQSVDFVTVCADPDGYLNIQSVQFIINTAISGANGFLGYYIQSTNKVYLMNDTGSAWLGGYAPGSANVIENSYVKLDYSKTTVSGSGTNLTIKWAVTFKTAFIGSKNTYLYIRDNAGAAAGWIFVGSWKIDNSPPLIVSITPVNGTSNSNQAVNFSTVYSDPDGYSNIQYVQLIFNLSITGVNGFLGYYIGPTNKLYLMNDTGTVWLGGFAPGSANVIENSYCKLDCSKTTISGSGNNLTVNWFVTFKTSFIGTKNIYLFVRDNASAYAGWFQKGTWAIANSPPSIVSITPASGTSNSNQSVDFVTVCADPDGYLNIQSVQFIINTAISGANGFLGYYIQSTNKVYLMNDTGSAWLGGYAPGSANVIENSYVKLDYSKTTVSGSGANLTIKWALTFKTAFIGSKNTYLYIRDNAGAAAGWTLKGDYCVYRIPISLP